MKCPITERMEGSMVSGWTHNRSRDNIYPLSNVKYTIIILPKARAEQLWANLADEIIVPLCHASHTLVRDLDRERCFRGSKGRLLRS